MIKEEALTKFHSEAEKVTKSVFTQFEKEGIPGYSKVIEYTKAKLDYYVNILNSRLLEVSNNILIKVAHHDANELSQTIFAAGKRYVGEFVEKTGIAALPSATI